MEWEGERHTVVGRCVAAESEGRGALRRGEIFFVRGRGAFVYWRWLELGQLQGRSVALS